MSASDAAPLIRYDVGGFLASLVFEAGMAILALEIAGMHDISIAVVCVSGQSDLMGPVPGQASYMPVTWPLPSL